MYDNNVPEQVIMEITNHKSDCVCIYKRTSDQLHEEASHTVSKSIPMAKIVKLENPQEEGSDSEGGKEEWVMSMDKMIENVKKTKAEIRQKNSC